MVAPVHGKPDSVYICAGISSIPCIHTASLTLAEHIYQTFVRDSNKMKLLIYCAAIISLAMATPIEKAQSSTFDQMGRLSRGLSRRLSLADSRNELEECKPVTVIFARGTIEPGNVGTLVGPPFFNTLELAIGEENVGVQGVDYAATVFGYLEGGDAEGGETLAFLAEHAVTLCPSTQIVLSGYRYFLSSRERWEVAHLR